MKKLSRFMEHFWLAVTIATTLWAIYMVATVGLSEGKQWTGSPWWLAACTATGASCAARWSSGSGTVGCERLIALILRWLPSRLFSPPYPCPPPTCSSTGCHGAFGALFGA